MPLNELTAETDAKSWREKPSRMSKVGKKSGGKGDTPKS